MPSGRVPKMPGRSSCVPCGLSARIPEAGGLRRKDASAPRYRRALLRYWQAVHSVMLATKIRYTFADLLEQDPADETIYDILGGELVVFSSPNPQHAAAVMELAAYLYDAQRSGHGLVRTAPLAVAFDYAERGTAAQDVTHPDLLFVRSERRAIFGRQCVEAAPDLIVEVLSPTTRTLDLPGGAKWDMYERYG